MPKPAVRKRERTFPAITNLQPSNFSFGDLRLHIEYRRPSELKPPRRALRVHEKPNITAIEASINEHGFLVPILVDAGGRIVVGQGRWLAATNLAIASVPVICVSHLTEEQIRIFTIADNKLAEKSKWDVDELRLELAELSDLSGFHKERDADLAAHATVKPWSMVADAIRDCSKRAGIILDPFGGSGTTLIAAERTGRNSPMRWVPSVIPSPTIIRRKRPALRLRETRSTNRASSSSLPPLETSSNSALPLRPLAAETSR